MAFTCLYLSHSGQSCLAVTCSRSKGEQYSCLPWRPEVVARAGRWQRPGSVDAGSLRASVGAPRVCRGAGEGAQAGAAARPPKSAHCRWVGGSKSAGGSQSQAHGYPRGCTEVPRGPPPPPPRLPVTSIPLPSGTSAAADEATLTPRGHPGPQLTCGVAAGVAQSVGANKCVVTSIHRQRTTQSGPTALAIPHAPPVHPPPPGVRPFPTGSFHLVVCV